MIDKEVILHLIDGPGATWGWIMVGLFAALLCYGLVRTLNGWDKAYEEGKTAARREGLDELRAQMAKVIYDVQQLTHREPAE